MPLRKALDDLRQVTLAALPGRWHKLLYFGRLRLRSPGKYSHWGFENRYGKEAEPAMREGHASVYREVLRAPIPELLEECLNSMTASDPLTEVSPEAMVPPEGESGSHFEYIVATLQALARHQKRP